ncbi:MAG: hypothetical protein ABIP78_12065 [Pyrinomonadaceae bacterium]
MPNLAATDLTVLQDGSPQTIEFFAATEEPLTIALLIDTSQSTRFVLGDIKDSVKSLIKLLSPQDRAMIVSFDYDTHILSPLTSVAVRDFQVEAFRRFRIGVTTHVAKSVWNVSISKPRSFFKSSRTRPPDDFIQAKTANLKKPLP